MDRPNILLITTDQQRFDGMSLNGNSVLRTANLDYLAASGMNFSRAYTTCPSCIAARRTLLTGQLPSTHGLVGYEDGLEFDPPFTLPGLLGRAGYQTQLIGKLHMYPQRKRYGFDNLVLSEQMEYRPTSRFFGQNDYADWLRNKGVSFNPASHGIGANSWVARPWPHAEDLHHTSWLAEEAVDFVARRRDPSCPFFLHLSFWAPHPPLVPPQAYWDRYVGDPRLAAHVAEWAPKSEPRAGVAPDSFVGPFPPDAIRDAIAGYYGAINHIDDRIAYVLTRIFETGGPRQKMPMWIIYTSDHGEMLGDHHLYRKALPYEGSAHVPFFISGRNVGRLPRRASDALVCLEDVFPTVCELAGVDVPAGVDGKSLMPILRGERQSVRDDLHGEHSGGYASHYLVAGQFKYCWFCESNEEQLFDLSADPYELHDLSGDRGEVLGQMRRRMAGRLAGRKDYSYEPGKCRPAGNRPPDALFARDVKGYAG
jgi:arylsulfatase